jgi:hypothetical protein
VKFNRAYQRVLIGNDIDVQIGAKNGENIFAVNRTLGSFVLASDDLRQIPAVSVHRIFGYTGESNTDQLH